MLFRHESRLPDVASQKLAERDNIGRRPSTEHITPTIYIKQKSPASAGLHVYLEYEVLTENRISLGNEKRSEAKLGCIRKQFKPSVN